MLDVTFNPNAFGIKGLLAKKLPVKVRGAFGNGVMYIAPPWQRGDLATEYRAAFETIARLKEVCQERILPWKVSWQTPSMKYDQCVMLVEIPKSLAGGLPSTSSVIEIWGKTYLNPTPFRFFAKDVKQVSSPTKGRIPNVIDLLTIAQPLEFPASGSGIYFAMENIWDFALVPTEAGPLRGLLLHAGLSGLAVKDGYLTGQELFYKLDYLGRITKDLAKMLRNSEAIRGELNHVAEFTQGNIPRTSPLFAEFIAKVQGYHPLIASTLAAGIEQVGS